MSAFYISNAVERPYYWLPYGIKIMVFLFIMNCTNAFNEISQEKSYLYTIETEESVFPFKNIPCDRLGIIPTVEKSDAFILI